jgi:hypothetical protein
LNHDSDVLLVAHYILHPFDILDSTLLTDHH